MKLLAALAVTSAAFLAGCTDAPPCPTDFENGSFVTHRVTGERYLVTRGNPFTNINSGGCSIIVVSEKGHFAVSMYEVELAQ